LTGKKYDKGSAGFPFRVIADHIRACTFLVIDGILPGNEGRGYVLRRILRRAVRFGKILGLNEPFFYRLVPAVIEMMKHAYPEVGEKQEYVEQVIRMEEERFLTTLNDGLRKVEDIVARLRREGSQTISGKDAFMLYDTFGFPIDLTEDVAEEYGLKVDKAEFEAMMEEQKERGRRSFKNNEAFALEKTITGILEGENPTDFVGYQCLEWESEVLAIIKNGEEVASAADEEAIVILMETPFYAESGGQVADVGVIKGPEGEMEVTDVQKAAGWILHYGTIKGALRQGQVVQARVDAERRKATAANHTATHLLHRALQETVGEYAQQKGSLVEPERLRFDFSHFAPLTPEEIQRIEEIVNEKVWSMLPVKVQQTSLSEAKKLGAVALFGEKYGEQVRVVEVEGFSRELCGGTHVKNTGEIGLFKIVSEASIGAGLRRIEAVTRSEAYRNLRQSDEELRRAAAIMKVVPAEVAERTEMLLRQLRETEKELEAIKTRVEKEKAANVLDQAVKVQDINVLTAEIQASDMNSLRENAETLRDKLGTSVVVLGSRIDDKVGLAAFVSKELAERGLHAGKIISEVAKIVGGGGGGRQDMAQAGGKNPAKLGEALQAAREIVENTLL